MDDRATQLRAELAALLRQLESEARDLADELDAGNIPATSIEGLLLPGFGNRVMRAEMMHSSLTIYGKED